MLIEFARWLNGTDFSFWLRHTPGVLMGVQIVHILGLAALMGSATLLNLRLVGLRPGGLGRSGLGRGRGLESQDSGGSADSAAHLGRRFLPAHWIGLVVLAVSGALLIVAEPGDMLFSPTLRIKLILIVLAVLLTLCVLRPLLRADAPLSAVTRERRAGLFAVGALSLLLWIAIAVAGRFIAYIG